MRSDKHIGDLSSPTSYRDKCFSSERTACVRREEDGRAVEGMLCSEVVIFEAPCPLKLKPLKHGFHMVALPSAQVVGDRKNVSFSRQCYRDLQVLSIFLTAV